MRPEVLVFVMESCGACEELKPLVIKTGIHYRTCIDTRVVDVDAESQFADLMGVEETPTVIGIDGNRQPIIRMKGHSGDPARLIAIYSKLLESATSCRVEPFQEI